MKTWLRAGFAPPEYTLHPAASTIGWRWLAGPCPERFPQEVLRRNLEFSADLRPEFIRVSYHIYKDHSLSELIFVDLCKICNMKSVLVPVDFSETSLNAAAYAVKLLTGVYGITMTLYHVFEKPEHEASARRELSSLKEKLFDIGIVKMDTVCEEGHDFAHNIDRWLKMNPADLIIMGITGRNKLGQALIGSNTLDLVRKNHCPVLIVPPDAKFNRLKNLVLASDFMSSPSPLTTDTIKDLLTSHYARLHIVNVNPEHNVTLPESYQSVQAKMQELFKGFQHEFHFIGLSDFPEAMNMFVMDHNVDMIATLPRDHHWLGKLFGSGNTKRLAYQSSIPVLAIH
jgi:nucleotide-binding universal stress UspA family protein